MAKQELVATTRHRYSQSSKKNTRNKLGEFTAITEHHRKDRIRLLGSTAGNVCCCNPYSPRLPASANAVVICKSAEWSPYPGAYLC